MKEEEETYPILDWIYFGLYQTEKGMNGYTYGMTAFGKDEIEVLESAAAPAELHEFLFDIASYVLRDDVLLKDGAVSYTHLFYLFDGKITLAL